MIGQFLMWVGRQDPMHVFFVVSAFLVYCVSWSYAVEIRDRQR